MKYNIIADVAGQYDCLMRLLKKMPIADKIVLVGDLNDRGPKSKQVIHWSMGEDDVAALDSNHGHMFVDFWSHWMIDDYRMMYHPGDFLGNGGYETIRSYMPKNSGPMSTMEAMHHIPASHIQWLDGLPWKFEADGLVVTHAPIPYYCDSAAPRFQRIWNRSSPRPMDPFQIFGHNAAYNVRWYAEPEPGLIKELETIEEPVFACCIDTSRAKKLTGMHWPTKEIFQEDYIEKMAVPEGKAVPT